MKTNEAYEYLGLEPGASDDDIKKAFRKFAVEYHPDRNKEAGAEEKFKKINEAHQILTGKQKSDDERGAVGFGPQSPFDFGSFKIEDIIGHFVNNGGFGFAANNKKKFSIDLSPIQISINVDFKKAVLGGTENIKYNIKNYCKDCGGECVDKGNRKKCKQCSGTGFISRTFGNGPILRTDNYLCDKCKGTGFIGNKCNSCDGNGYNLKEISLNITIPPIGSNTTRMNAAGAGHMFNKKRGDAIFVLFPIVEDKEKNMILSGRNVVSYVNIGLDKLIFGGSIEVETVDGKKTTVDIEMLNEIGTEKILTGKGALRYGNMPQGDHVVIIDIKYPEKSKLNDSLKRELEKAYNEEEICLEGERKETTEQLEMETSEKKQQETKEKTS